MKKAYNKWFFTKVKRAIRDYNMIQAGDRIAVGVSGGKDSSTLLYILSLLRKHSHLKFDFQAVTLDLGQGADLSPLVDYCRQHDIPLHIEPTKIGHIVFNVRQETNPCSLCANLRRGALHQAARKLGCNKVALGHHLDDAIETLLMNIIFTGKLGTFSPWVYLDRMDLTLIRPMIYLPQETVVSLYVKKNCPSFIILVLRTAIPSGRKCRSWLINWLKTIRTLGRKYSLPYKMWTLTTYGSKDVHYPKQIRTR